MPPLRSNLARTAATALAALAILGACTGEFPTSAEQRRLARDTFDGAALASGLAQIAAWHETHRTTVAAGLAPGLPAARIAHAFAGSKCQPTREMQALWSWHDGEDGADPFIWYHDFLPLAAAAAEYRALLRNPLVRWDPHYFPVFAFEGEWYAAYCGPDGDSAGPVVHFFLEDEPTVAFVNLTTLVASMAEMLRTGAVGWDRARGGMVEDIRQVRRIHQRLNPGYPFPYHVPD